MLTIIFESSNFLKNFKKNIGNHYAFLFLSSNTDIILRMSILALLL